MRWLTRLIVRPGRRPYVLQPTAICVHVHVLVLARAALCICQSLHLIASDGGAGWLLASEAALGLAKIGYKLANVEGKRFS